MQIILSTFICFLLVVAPSASIVFADQTDFQIKVGIMKPASPTKDRLWETNVLTMDPTRRPGFCFLIVPSSEKPYEVYSITYLPKEPKNLTGEFQKMKLPTALNGLKTKPKHVDGIRPFCFDFHKGDPLGKYILEIFVNKTLKTTLILDVVPLESNQEKD
jgi:hypothetical protein